MSLNNFSTTIQIIFKTLQSRYMINLQYQIELKKLMANIYGKIGFWLDVSSMMSKIKIRNLCCSTLYNIYCLNRFVIIFMIMIHGWWICFRKCKTISRITLLRKLDILFHQVWSKNLWLKRNATQITVRMNLKQRQSCLPKFFNFWHQWRLDWFWTRVEQH